MKKASTAEEVHELFGIRFQNGDLDGLVALYEPNAIIAPQADQITGGHEGIRSALTAFLALNGNFTTTLNQALHGDGVALLYSNWEIDAKLPDGTPQNMSGQTSDVVRRQPDGSWLFAIDSPFGGGWKN